jgi:1-acyl-sn-glycerol-3-phosphate acyltransferase
MPHPLAYVFKRELLYLPFFGWALGRLEMIHIDRSRGAEAWDKVATQGRRIMDRGVWIIMFPEGTRTPRGSQGRYKTGAARLAVATGTPIVPIAISSGRCWPRRSWLLRPGTIDVVIGRPIAAEGRDPESLMREVQTWIEDQMRRIDPEAYAGELASAGPSAAPPAAS